MWNFKTWYFFHRSGVLERLSLGWSGMFPPLSNRKLHTVHDSPILTVNQVNCKAKCATVMTIWPDIPHCFVCVHRHRFITERQKPRFLHSQQNSCIQEQNRCTDFVLHSLSPPKDRYSQTVTFSGKRTNNFSILSQDLQSLFPTRWSHYNCAHFLYPRYLLHAQSTVPTNVRNKSINTPYWTYTTSVEFKAFRIITLFITGVNWWRSKTCQRTASRFWHTATRRIMYKKVVSDKLCVSEISGLPQLQYLCNTENSELQIHIKLI